MAQYETTSDGVFLQVDGPLLWLSPRKPHQGASETENDASLAVKTLGVRRHRLSFCGNLCESTMASEGSCGASSTRRGYETGVSVRRA